MKYRLIVVCAVFIIISITLTSIATAGGYVAPAEWQLSPRILQNCTIKYVCTPEKHTSRQTVKKPTKVPVKKHKPLHRANKPSPDNSISSVIRSIDDPEHRRLIDPTGTGTPNLYETRQTPAESFESQIRNYQTSQLTPRCNCICVDDIMHYVSYYTYVRTVYITQQSSRASSSDSNTAEVAEPPPFMLLSTGIIGLLLIRLRKL